MQRPENLIDADVAKFLRRTATDLVAQGGADTMTLKQAREICGVIQVHGHRLAQALSMMSALEKEAKG